MIPFIDLKAQYSALSDEINSGIKKVLEHGQFIMGPEVRELEAALEEYVGVEDCITVSSGTDALLISLMAVGVKPGDEVITTPFTFVSTAEVIVRLGAIPVFVDIEPDTCNIDAQLIERRITSRTKAIVPVSLFGQTADMSAINKIASGCSIPVIEDAAQSFGAKYGGNYSCGLSTIGCTSFFPSKSLGCYGDGGAIFTSNSSVASAARSIRVHGQSKKYQYDRLGVGGRMDTIQCAVVLAKLKRFEWELERRRRVAANYQMLLDECSMVTPLVVRQDRESCFSQFSIITPDRDSLADSLKKSGIPTAVYYPTPLDRYSPYAAFASAEHPSLNASRISDNILSLPMGPYLSERDQMFIVDSIVNFYAS